MWQDPQRSYCVEQNYNKKLIATNWTKKEERSFKKQSVFCVHKNEGGKFFFKKKKKR